MTENKAYQEIFCRKRENLEKIKELFSTEDKLDFNKVLPVPESILKRSVPSDFYAVFCFLVPKGEKASKDKIEKTIQNLSCKVGGNLKNIDLDKLVGKCLLLSGDEGVYGMAEDMAKGSISFWDWCLENKTENNAFNYGRLVLENLLLYGLTTCQEWVLENWGTIRNSGETTWNIQSVAFESHLFATKKIAKEISRKPNIPLFFLWNESYSGEQAGFVSFDKGDTVLEKTYERGTRGFFNIRSYFLDKDQKLYRWDTETKSIVEEWFFRLPYRDEDLEFEGFPKVDTSILELETFLRSQKVGDKVGNKGWEETKKTCNK